MTDLFILKLNLLFRIASSNYLKKNILGHFFHIFSFSTACSQATCPELDAEYVKKIEFKATVCI